MGQWDIGCAPTMTGFVLEGMPVDGYMNVTADTWAASKPAEVLQKAGMSLAPFPAGTSTDE